jgi:hypothetical protein
MAVFTGSGSADLYHNGIKKLATTSTGIDVTGTVTADSLTVDGVFDFSTSVDGIINSPASLYINFDSDNNSAGEKFVIGSNRTGASGGNEHFRVDASGNVGIGTSSPVTLKSSTTLQVNGNAKLGDDNARGLLSLGDIGSTGANVGIWRGAAGAYAGTGNYLNLGGYSGITFTTGAADIASQTERMRIDSSGNVGIGTSSPDTLLHLSDTLGGAVLRLERNDTAIVGTDQYGAIEFEGQDANAGASGVRASMRAVAEASLGQTSLTFSTRPNIFNFFYSRFWCF